MIEQILANTAAWLSGIQSWLIYFAIGSIAFIENIFFPFPGDVLLVFSAVFVKQGRVDFAAAYFSSVVGGALGYFSFFLILRWANRFLDHPLLIRIFPLKDRERVHDMFVKYGAALIIVNRFITGVRSMVAVIASIAQYPRGLFLLYSFISCAIYNLLLFLLGFLAGESVTTVDQMLASSITIFKQFGWIPVSITIVTLVLIIIYIFRTIRKSKTT